MAANKLKNIIFICLIFLIFILRSEVSNEDYKEVLIEDSNNKKSDYWEIFETEEHKNLVLTLRENGFSGDEIELLFFNENFEVYQKEIISAGKQLPLEEYKKIILSEKSLAKGIEFIKRNELIFNLAEKKYGVKKEDVAAILRVETDFGGCIGEYKIFNVFYSVYYHHRSENVRKSNWAKKEMIVFLKIAKENNFKLYGINGSRAGAFGMPQFMPTSYEYAVDGSGDGKIDLFDEKDAIFSVANYLRKNGYAKSREKAFYNYNHSKSYVEIAVFYAEALKKYKKIN